MSAMREKLIEVVADALLQIDCMDDESLSYSDEAEIIIDAVLAALAKATGGDAPE